MGLQQALQLPRLSNQRHTQGAKGHERVLNRYLFLQKVLEGHEQNSPERKPPHKARSGQRSTGKLSLSNRPLVQ